ncbi:MAG: flavin reductase family protein [Acidobacteria bacterium]|nr:flavin reductase family protein [Acidobacteriota bacterium]
MQIDPRDKRYQDIYRLMVGAVVPRPIAFVSTIDPNGRLNLAPFSYFTAGSSNPPCVVFSPQHRGPEKAAKDTLRNVCDTREFVVNIVSEEFVNQMNATAAEFPPQISEFEISGLTPVPSERVRPPRVKESHVQMECQLVNVITVSDKPGGGSLVIGEVILFHVDEAVLADPEHDIFKIDPDKLRAVGRMGGISYTRTLDRFEIARPKWPS